MVQQVGGMARAQALENVLEKVDRTLIGEYDQSSSSQAHPCETFQSHGPEDEHRKKQIERDCRPLSADEEHHRVERWQGMSQPVHCEKGRPVYIIQSIEQIQRDWFIG